MHQRGDRNLAKQLLTSLEAAADAQNTCLAFCLYQALLIEPEDRVFGGEAAAAGRSAWPSAATATSVL